MAASLPWKVSSTVIIMSKTTGRVLMMRRGPNAKFMPNAFVFPGGLLDKVDQELGSPSRICAIREAFEETGLLLTSNGVKSAASDSKLAEKQDLVNKDPNSFKEIFDKGAIEKLIPLSTWLTPTAYPKRFKTDFYLFPVEGEPEIRMCQREMAEYGWGSPKELLAKGEEGALPPPQVYKMTVLSQIGIPELQKMSPTSRVIAPQKVTDKDGYKVAMVLPGDHLYIEENAEFVPLRTVEDKILEPDLEKPTHRVQYVDHWKNPKVFQHLLQEPYKTIFRKIKCHSPQSKL